MIVKKVEAYRVIHNEHVYRRIGKDKNPLWYEVFPNALELINYGEEEILEKEFQAYMKGENTE